MFIATQGILPNYLTNSFKWFDQIHEYTAKQAQSSFQLPKPNTNYVKRAYSYRGAVVWNNLPKEIKTLTSVGNFRPKWSVTIFHELTNHYKLCR